MFSSTDEPVNQVVRPSPSTGESRTSLINLNSDCFDGLPTVSNSSDSPNNPTTFTDVKLVPEHEKEEFKQAISNLEGEISALRSQQQSLDEKRREALNRILDIKGSIRVLCRARPLLPIDKKKTPELISTGLEKVCIRSLGNRKDYSFDRVFPQDVSQEDVFAEVKPILRSALDGHNVCIFAYGQTGTGKTFTMEGTPDRLGIVPRAIRELFHQASLDSSVSFMFKLSMLEVYMGSLRDLLGQKSSPRTAESVTRCGLNIQTDSNGFVEIENLIEVEVADFAQANRWYMKGRRARSTSRTNVNEASSRSHCLLRIKICRFGNVEEGKSETSKLWMVDLGGSERLLKTGAIGQTLDEGKAINLSLSALGDVISALKRKRNHIPYRNSKLTQILRDSLCDGSKALMLVHISPRGDDIGETICSLNFAKRTRGIESDKELSEDLKRQREKKISEFDQEMKFAEEERQKVIDHIQRLQSLVCEKKRLFSMAYRILDDQMVSPERGLREATDSPQIAEKSNIGNGFVSQPRFMTSTVASRQRQIMDCETRGIREQRLKLKNRSSIELDLRPYKSRSLPYSDPHFKSNLQSSSSRPLKYNNKKPGPDEPISLLPEPLVCSSMDSPRLSSMPLNKRLSASFPNPGVKLCQHRRRDSDLDLRRKTSLRSSSCREPSRPSKEITLVCSSASGFSGEFSSDGLAASGMASLLTTGR